MIAEPVNQPPAKSPESEHLEAATCDAVPRVLTPEQLQLPSWGATYPGGAPQPPPLRPANLKKSGLSPFYPLLFLSRLSSGRRPRSRCPSLGRR